MTGSEHCTEVNNQPFGLRQEKRQRNKQFVTNRVTSRREARV